ncbi:MAG: HDIG domain-containing metalloprotein [Syntrophales bacterium]
MNKQYKIEKGQLWISAASRKVIDTLNLKGRHSLQRWAILIGMSFILSIFITPQIHLIRPEFKMGQIASRDVRADRDIFVEDRAATQQKRFEASSQILSIYDYAPDVYVSITENIRKSFQNMEAHYSYTNGSGNHHTDDIRREILEGRRNFEKFLGISLTEDEFNTLDSRHFAPYAASRIIKLLFEAYKSKWITNVTFLPQDVEKGIMIQDIDSKEAYLRKDLSPIRHIGDIQQMLTKKALELFPYDSVDFRSTAASLAAKLIQPNLTFNRNETEARKKATIESIPPVLFKIQSGEMIIREGEKINSTAIDKLDAFYREKGKRFTMGLSLFVGIFLLILFFSATLSFIAKHWIEKHSSVTKITLFLATLVLLEFVLIRVGIFIAVAFNRAFPFFPTEVCLFAIPFAAGAMLTSILIHREMALIFAVFTSFMTSFLFSSSTIIPMYTFLGSVTASYMLTSYKRRSTFLKASLFLSLINIITIFIFSLISKTTFTLNTLLMMGMGVAGGLSAGILVAGLMPVFETLFGYTTDIRLLELANLNQPIFQQMILEAPGTYHHSIIVGSLVEAAAEAIGANSLLVKVSAYYHDIGKLEKPQYYIENQKKGENLHDRLSPKMSSLVIISHVKDGCELAESLKLCREVVNIIREHHGTSKVGYFFEKAQKDPDPSIRSLPEIDFRYPGPKPQTKEAALVLIGDVVEASSRSLDNPTPSRIEHLVHERIDRIFLDGQLDESELTLKDLNIIAESFIRILHGIFHQRIDYSEPVVREFTGSSKNSNDYNHRKPSEAN